MEYLIINADFKIQTRISYAFMQLLTSDKALKVEKGLINFREILKISNF